VRSLTRDQSRRVDQLAMDELGIPGIVLMENAARGIAEAAKILVGAPEKPIAVVCGPGNNGGDGFAAARHLHNSGYGVRIHLLAVPEVFPPGSDAAINLAVARSMRLAIHHDLELQDAGLIVDAVFGTGLSRAVRPPYDEALQAINDAGCPVLAADLPSGLDADTGAVLGVAVRASVTATMVAPKVGFALGAGPAHIGRVVIVDIGCPPELLDRV